MKPVIPRVPLSPRELGELAQLLFEWPVRQSPRLALPFFIFVAALVQVGMFLLFSISYRTPSETRPAAPTVYFLPPDSAAARQLAPWLEANDPAAFSPIRASRAAVPEAPPLRYRPSYEEPPPPLRALPDEPPVVMQPPALPLTGAMKANSPVFGNLTNAPAAIFRTTIVQWKDALACRIPADGVTAPPSPASTGVMPALYQVGIAPEGIPLHCVLLESSGDSASDEAARIWIMAQRFQPAEAESWGRVLVLWGTPASAGSKSSLHP
jgi:hypothetical protein